MVSAREFIEENLVIRTKDARIVPLRLNPAQERLYAALEQQRAAGRPMRVIILKARQLGFSTLAEALIFQRTATQENVNSLVVAHREDFTANLFKMSKLFFERLPEELRPPTPGALPPPPPSPPPSRRRIITLPRPRIRRRSCISSFMRTIWPSGARLWTSFWPMTSSPKPP